METALWQSAIDAASAAGGGVVSIPPGDHVCGQLVLKSGVTLKLEEGARLVGSGDPADFRDLAPQRALPGFKAAQTLGFSGLVLAENAENVAILGPGTIDGNGGAFPKIDSLGRRPRLVQFRNCRGVRIQGATLRNSPRWTCFLQECEDVVVRRVRIDGHANFNNDGLDIEGRNVLVEDCDIDAGDDGLCLKSFNPGFAVERVRVRNCRVASNCCFLKLGTHGLGAYRDIEFRDCVLRTCRTAENGHRWDQWDPPIPGLTASVCGISGIALEMVDGGVLEDVRFVNIDMAEANVQTPVFVRMGRRSVNPSGRPSRLENVLIENVRARPVSAIASSITGVPGLRPRGIVLRNVEIEALGGGTAADAVAAVPECEDGYPENRMFGGPLPAWGFYLRHADDVRFESVRLGLAPGAKDARPPTAGDDCRGCDLRGWRVAAARISAGVSAIGAPSVSSSARGRNPHEHTSGRMPAARAVAASTSESPT